MSVPSRPPKVSVVVATHNRGATLREHADSILGQDYPDFEVVYVDDASSDDTPGILESLRAAHPGRVRVIRVHAGAPGPARNAGVEQASGEILLFTDDDVIVAPDWIAKMLASFQAYGCDALCGGVTPHSLDTKVERYFHYRSRILFASKPKRIVAAHMMSFMISRTLFVETGGFLPEPLAAAEDWELCLRLGQRGMTIFYDPSVSVVHRYQRDPAAARRRIRATGALGIYIYHKQGRNVAAYTVYATLRFLASPVGVLLHYPPDLYFLALRMESIFWMARVQAFVRLVRGREISFTYG